MAGAGNVTGGLILSGAGNTDANAHGGRIGMVIQAAAGGTTGACFGIIAGDGDGDATKT